MFTTPIESSFSHTSPPFLRRALTQMNIQIIYIAHIFAHSGSFVNTPEGIFSCILLQFTYLAL